MIRIAGRMLVVLTFVHVPLLLAQQPASVPYRTPEEQARLDVGPLVARIIVPVPTFSPGSRRLRAIQPAPLTH